MDGFTIETMNAISNSPTAYLTLFMILLYYVLKSSNQREKEMRDQLDKIVPILDNLVSKVDYIEKRLKGDN